MPRKRGKVQKKTVKKAKIRLSAKDKALLKQYNIKNSYVDITYKNPAFLMSMYNMDRILERERYYILWDKYHKYIEDCMNDNPKNEQLALFKLEPTFNVYDLIQTRYLFERITNVKRKVIALILSDDEKTDEELIAKNISEIYLKLGDRTFMKTAFYKELRILANRMFINEEEYKRQRMIDEYYHELMFGKCPIKHLHWMRETYDLPVPKLQCTDDEETINETENLPIAFPEGIASTSRSVPKASVQNDVNNRNAKDVNVINISSSDDEEINSLDNIGPPIFQPTGSNNIRMFVSSDDCTNDDIDTQSNSSSSVVGVNSKHTATEDLIPKITSTNILRPRKGLIDDHDPELFNSSVDYSDESSEHSSIDSAETAPFLETGPSISFSQLGSPLYQSTQKTEEVIIERTDLQDILSDDECSVVTIIQLTEPTQNSCTQTQSNLHVPVVKEISRTESQSANKIIQLQNNANIVIPSSSEISTNCNSTEIEKSTPLSGITVSHDNVEPSVHLIDAVNIRLNEVFESVAILPQKQFTKYLLVPYDESEDEDELTDNVINSVTCSSEVAVQNIGSSSNLLNAECQNQSDENNKTPEKIIKRENIPCSPYNDSVEYVSIHDEPMDISDSQDSILDAINAPTPVSETQEMLANLLAHTPTFNTPLKTIEFNVQSPSDFNSNESEVMDLNYHSLTRDQSGVLQKKRAELRRNCKPQKAQYVLGPPKPPAKTKKVATSNVQKDTRRITLTASKILEQNNSVFDDNNLQRISNQHSLLSPIVDIVRQSSHHSHCNTDLSEVIFLTPCLPPPVPIPTIPQNITLSDTVFQATPVNVHLITIFLNYIRLIEFKYKKPAGQYNDKMANDNLMEATFTSNGDTFYATGIFIPKLFGINETQWISFKNLLKHLNSFEYYANSKVTIRNQPSCIHRVLTTFLSVLPQYMGKTVKYANSSKKIMDICDEGIEDIVKSKHQFYKILEKGVNPQVRELLS